MTTLFGCGSAAKNGVAPPPDAQITEDAGFPPPEHGFQIVSPTVDIAPATEITYCYYFRTPNTSDIAIKKWASHMTAGGHHLIVYLTPQKLGEPGTLVTLDNNKCGLANIGVKGPVWAYAAQDPDHEVALPLDDGNGLPVGQPVPAGQYGFLQMHYLNSTDATIHTHVELNAYAHDDGVQVTSAAPFVTFNTQIDLAAAPSAQMPTTGTFGGNCNVSSDAKFYMMTTYTHKQGVHATIKDGATTVFDSANWEHPGTKQWDTAPFYSFTSGKLTYQCDYVNPNNYRIQYGDDTVTQEMCMAIGYYFPAAGQTGQFCLNSLML